MVDCLRGDDTRKRKEAPVSHRASHVHPCLLAWVLASHAVAKESARSSAGSGRAPEGAARGDRVGGAHEAEHIAVPASCARWELAEARIARPRSRPAMFRAPALISEMCGARRGLWRIDGTGDRGQLPKHRFCSTFEYVYKHAAEVRLGSFLALLASARRLAMSEARRRPKTTLPFKDGS